MKLSRALGVLICAIATMLSGCVGDQVRHEMRKEQALMGSSFCFGGHLDSTKTICCADSCGNCSATYCSSKPGGAAACCPNVIQTSGPSCLDASVPCALYGDPYCQNGIKSSSGDVCCPQYCGTCGGANCDERGEGCCEGSIETAGQTCAHHSAPCVLDGDPLCENGIANGRVCCAASCGACAQSGCSARPGGAAACCPTTITNAANSCLDHGPACVMDADAECDRGVLDTDTTVDARVCCAASCGTCGGSGCSTRPGGSSACCKSNILTNAPSCLASEAPCIVEDLTDPFVHPGLLNSQAELETIRDRATDVGYPIMNAGWEELVSSPLADLGYEPDADGCEVTVLEPGCSLPCEEKMRNDAQATYLHALQWVVTGTQAHADKAMEIMDLWANTLQSISYCNDSLGKQCDDPETGPEEEGACERTSRHESAWVAGMWAPAAEIIRHFDSGSAGWAPSDIQKFGQLLEKIIQRSKANVHPKLMGSNNRIVAVIHAFIAVGVFNDDRQLYEEGLAAWKYIHPLMIDGNGVLDELVEERDCHHYLYSHYAMAQTAEIAWHQGDNLFGIKIGGETRARLEKSLQFIAQAELGYEDLPAVGTAGQAGYQPAVSCACADAPGLMLTYNHYKHRAALELPASNLSLFESMVTTCGLFPDASKDMFLGWSAATHGNLSAP